MLKDLPLLFSICKITRPTNFRFYLYYLLISISQAYILLEKNAEKIKKAKNLQFFKNGGIENRFPFKFCIKDFLIE